MSDERKYARAGYFAHLLICIGGGAFLLYVFLRFGLKIILPFVIGWAVASLISPVAKRLAGKSQRGERVWSVVLLVTLLSLLGFLLVVGANRLFREAGQLLVRLSEGEFSDISLRIVNLIKKISERLPTAAGEGGFFDFSEEIVTNLVSGVVSGATELLTDFLSATVMGVPSLVLFVFVTVLSGFYFCLDISAFHSFVRGILPHRISAALPDVKRKVMSVAGRYFRAYVLLLVMTFCQLFLGFGILRVSYSFLLALVISFVDILPVLGVGSVLIPWALFSFASDRWNLGVGLLVIYGCVTVVRQIAEPKIVGGSIGLHPLATLISMYAGVKLLGVTGILLGPVVAIAAKSCFEIAGRKRGDAK